MKLSVIIVSYNVKYYLEQCLMSVQRATRGMDAEVFVVDNHSHDGTVEYLRERFPDIQLIESNHNLGFARANNLAIGQSNGDYLLLLNPDTIVGESVLASVVEFMDAHPDAGALGVQMLQSDGQKARESRRGLPSPMTAFYKMTGLCRRFPSSKRFGHYYMSNMPWDVPGEIEVVSGAFCLLRRSVLEKVGALDEDFFMYGEDIDLSYRILKGGFHNWYHPARILHYKGESTQKSSFRYVHVFYDAMLIFFRKHYSQLSMFISLPVRLAIFVRASIAVMGTLAGRLRLMMGFKKAKLADDLSYFFIGNEQSVAVCREIARRKGLRAEFLVGNSQTCPRGHLGRVEPPADECLFVVYDVDAYSYDEMLALLAENPQPNVQLGTFSMQTKTIITHREILL
jgi:GT2 family glycosyltransferase